MFDSRVLIDKLRSLNEKSELNKKLAKKLNRLIYLGDNNVKIYEGERGGTYYLSHNNNRIYL